MTMDKKKATAPAPAAVGDEGVTFAAMSKEELVKLWEDLMDEDKEVAGELFWEALMRDAAAEYKEIARLAGKEEGDHPHARFFEPCQPSKPDSPPPPPEFKSNIVLALCAPPHLARKLKRTPPAPRARPL